MEKRLELVEKPEGLAANIQPGERQQLLTLVEALSEPALSQQLCQEIGLQMCALLNGGRETILLGWKPPPAPVLESVAIEKV